MWRALGRLRRYRAIALLLSVCALRTLVSRSDLELNTMAELFFDALVLLVFAAWGLVHVRNIVSPWTRRLLLAIVALIVLWLLLRIVKWRLTSTGSDVSRFLWYSFYLPICLMPALGVFCISSVGKPPAWRPGWPCVALVLVALVLFLGVATNDYHGLMFRFSPPLRVGGLRYGYGPLRHVVVGFVVACTLGTIAMLVRRSHVPVSRSLLVLPLVPPVLGVTYGAVYPLLPRSDMTLAYCLLTALEFEVLIDAGLIHVNRDYRELFEASSLRAELLDEHGGLRVSSRNAPGAQGEGRAGEQGLSVHSIPVTGGSFCWVEDNTLEHAARRQLEERNAELEEDAELARARVDMRRRRAELDTRLSLYARVERDLAGKFALMGTLVDEGESDVSRREELLAELCVVGCYVKRRCNLVILEGQRPQASASELFWCLRESCDHLREAGVAATVSSTGAGELTPAAMERVFDLFEAVVEWSYPTLRALLAHLELTESCLRLSLQIECDEGVFTSQDLGLAMARLELLGSSVRAEPGKGSWSVGLTVPLGGDA